MRRKKEPIYREESELVERLVREECVNLIEDGALEYKNTKNKIIFFRALTKIKEAINLRYKLKLSNRNVVNVFAMWGGRNKSYRLDGKVISGFAVPRDFLNLEKTREVK
jgi:hypothetical protein